MPAGLLHRRRRGPPAGAERDVRGARHQTPPREAPGRVPPADPPPPSPHGTAFATGNAACLKALPHQKPAPLRGALTPPQPRLAFPCPTPPALINPCPPARAAPPPLARTPPRLCS